MSDTSVTYEADIKLIHGLLGKHLEINPELRERASYHGIGPLLLARAGAKDFQEEARACAMWELRHRHVLNSVLDAFSAAGIRCLLMKGTALAYDLYQEPALRPRGDSDLLIDPSNLEQARHVLREQGFYAGLLEDASEALTQEPWRIAAPDQSTHDIDLHWQALNGPAMANVIPSESAFEEAVSLPKLGGNAMAVSHPHALLHACVHRAQHILSPYFVDGKAYYGGDRLIWLCDIDLLAKAMKHEDWANFIEKAAQGGVAPVCHRALLDATRLLHTPVPHEVMADLEATAGGPETEYLLSAGRAGRALFDVKASGLQGALKYARARLFPAEAFIRAQYPQSQLPLPLLYLRRIWRFLRGRAR